MQFENVSTSTKHSFMARLCILSSMVMLWGLMITSFATAQPASSPRIDLKYPGLNIFDTLPPGFCPAVGLYADMEKAEFATEPDQYLLVAAFRCETMAAGRFPTEEFTIKTGRSAINMSLGDRSSFLNSGSMTNGGGDNYGRYTITKSDLNNGNKIVHELLIGAVTEVKHRMIILDYLQVSLSPIDQDPGLRFIKEQTRRLVEENDP